MGRLVIIALVLAAIATPAASVYYCEVYATCTDDVMTIHVSLQNIMPPDDYQGVLVHRWTLGECDSDLVLNPDAPLALPAEQGEVLTHELTDVVVVGLGYFYRAVLLDLDGNEIPFSFPFPTYSVAGCGDWPITRGVILDVDIPQYASFAPCECWFQSPAVDLSAIDPEVYTPLIGQMVELRGWADFDEMPGAAEVIADAIVPVAGCDEPVAARPRSWSAIKERWD